MPFPCTVPYFLSHSAHVNCIPEAVEPAPATSEAAPQVPPPTQPPTPAAPPTTSQKINRISSVPKPGGLDPLLILQERENRSEKNTNLII